MGRARVWVGLLLLWSCSGDDDPAAAGAFGEACKGGGDERCGESCDPNRPCALGFHCTEQMVCAKDCDLDTPCPGGGECTTNGMCRGGDGGTSSGGPTRPGSCADSVVTATRTTPTVILIVDQSSSMNEDFGDDSRWDVLRDFLLEEDGLIADLQSQVHFGLALYSAESGGSSPEPIGECPMVTTVPPAPNNYEAIAEVYRDAEPIEDTPTGDSINRIIDDLGLDDPDDSGNPVVFVLATDGEPDRCEELDPQRGQDETLDAVRRAYSLGIRTFIISVGDEVSEDHQQDVANAGLGREPGEPDAEFWVAGDDRSLRDALTSIVGGQLGCEIALNGSVRNGDPCQGSVTLNGQRLECDDPNGWELLDPEHIRLLGDACDELKSSDDVYLDVIFPCTVNVVF